MASTSPFDRAVAIVLKHEGGLVDNPADPGGITKYGISIRLAGSINLDLDGDDRTTAADITALSVENAKGIYLGHFWLKTKCDELPLPLAICVFDSAVNQGPRAASIMLQRSVGAKADGWIGGKTLAKIRGSVDSGRLNDILLDFMARRAKRYALTANIETFGRGWYRRLFDVFAEATTEREHENSGHEVV